MKQQLIKEITDEVVKYVPDTFIGNNFCDCKISNELKACIYNHQRDITLEDILIALENIGFGDIAIDATGCFWEISYGIADIPTYERVNWIMGKPLHEQDEETLKFIRNILK